MAVDDCASSGEMLLYVLGLRDLNLMNLCILQDNYCQSNRESLSNISIFSFKGEELLSGTGA